jgi:hypothetical protein
VIVKPLRRQCKIVYKVSDTTQERYEINTMYTYLIRLVGASPLTGSAGMRGLPGCTNPPASAHGKSIVGKDPLWWKLSFGLGGHCSGATNHVYKYPFIEITCL